MVASSSAAPKIPEGNQKAEFADLPAVHFADPEGFAFMPLPVGVSGVETEFRIVQQGYTASLLRNSLGMRYGSPTLAHPSHRIELEQRDLATSRVIPNPSLAYEERQRGQARQASATAP